MKIAVTGSSGFIGGHILKEMVSRGIETVAIDVRPQSNPVDLDLIEYICFDLNDVDTNTFDFIGRPDSLIHLAWGGLPNYRSLHHFETELPKQYRFLSTLVNSGLKSLVGIGTCFEYGMQSGALVETMSSNPDNPYGFAKNTLRKELEFLREVTPFSLTWARLFYMYGDGQAPSSLLPQLSNAVKKGDAVFNMSGGEQLRDYLSVSEIAKNIVNLAEAKADIGVVNISSGKPISVKELVNKWILENNWDIELNLGHYPYPDYEPMEFWGDCEKLLGFNKAQ